MMRNSEAKVQNVRLFIRLRNQSVMADRIPLLMNFHHTEWQYSNSDKDTRENITLTFTNGEKQRYQEHFCSGESHCRLFRMLIQWDSFYKIRWEGNGVEWRY